MKPLVSAIMPTANRRSFIPGALRCFLQQTYPNKELVIVDDGDDPVSGIIPDHPAINYTRVRGPLGIGAKRNICCEIAKGDIIWHLDDDDWSSPTRMEEQVQHLTSSGKGLVGYSSILFLDVVRNRLYALKSTPGFVCCTSFAYTREFWQRYRFEGKKRYGEDNIFLAHARDDRELGCYAGEHQMVARVNHGGNTSPRGELLDPFIQVPMDMLPPINHKPRRIMLSMLSWNTRDVTMESAEAMMAEAHRLRTLGDEAYISWVDNGSSDGSRVELMKMSQAGYPSLDFKPYPVNMGSSLTRNHNIDLAEALRMDYLLMTDSDLEVVPFSSWAMVNYMDSHPNLGVLGAFSGSYTDKRKSATPVLDQVTETQPCDVVAWTQYGMFRMKVFQGGVRFPTLGPMAKPGWGWEDNDLQMQMMDMGWGNEYITNMTYLHRQKHGSWDNLRGEGLDPEQLWNKRREQFLQRWEGTEMFGLVKQHYQGIQFPGRSK